MSNDLLRNEGLVRTDMWCHDCQKNFIASLNYDLDGNLEVECPHCGHLHYRKIKGGKVTGERYDSDSRTHKVAARHVWKSTTQPVMTSSASAFIRNLWINRDS